MFFFGSFLCFRVEGKIFERNFQNLVILWRQFWAIFCSFWQFLAVFGSFWQFLAVLGSFDALYDQAFSGKKLSLLLRRSRYTQVWYCNVSFLWISIENFARLVRQRLNLILPNVRNGPQRCHTHIHIYTYTHIRTYITYICTYIVQVQVAT